MTPTRQPRSPRPRWYCRPFEATAAWRLHQEGADPETVVSELERWTLLPRARAAKVGRVPASPDVARVHHLLRRGIRAVPTFVDDDPRRFSRLLNEQLVPEDLIQA